MHKLVSHFLTGLVGVIAGVSITTGVFMSQPTEFDQDVARLKTMGFSGGVEEPGLDYVRVTVTSGDRICSARMRFLGDHGWTATADNGDFIQRIRITPDELKDWLHC